MSTSYVTVGFDPDTKTSAWAICDAENLYACGMYKTRGSATGVKAEEAQIDAMVAGTAYYAAISLTHPTVIVCEGQDTLRRTMAGGKRIPADGLFRIARVTGAFALLSKLYLPHAKLLIPPAAGHGAWKTSVKKSVHQMRILQRMNLTLEHVAEMAGVTTIQANHIVDAIGLARFGALGAKQQ